MKILFFSILSIMIMTTLGFSNDVFASENNQICVDKIWIENLKGKIACVTPLLEQLWLSVDGE